MCGITGALDLSGKRLFDTERLLKMAGAIAHRGPDDEQIHIEPGLAFASRRLAIIDLAEGHQPICNKSGDIWASFNGELFDYPLLRQFLLARGHTFKTHCDTEAWVHLYEDFGEAMFEHAKGQFAVALWDRKKRSLILGRDRVGICPLYYTVRDGWLLWGSEIKALLASGIVPAIPDRKGVDHLFNFYGPGTTRTFFEGIKLLPPGHFIRVSEGNIQLHKYWDLDFPDSGHERRETDVNVLVDELEAIFNQAVKRRFHSDVPVVSYLSGGLDSSIVLETACRLQGKPMPSFTISMNKNTGPDETSHATQVASLVGSDLTALPMNAEKIANSFPELITAIEGPVLDASCAALMLLAGEINKQGFKVALTGEGADEAFAGYIWFKGQRISRWFGESIPRLTRKLLWPTIHRGPRRGLITPDLGVKGVRPAQQLMYESISLARETLYSEDMWQALEGHDPYTDLDLPSDRIQRWDPLNQSIYVNYKVMLAGLLLISKGDRIAMHSSVETRFPFLDETLIQFCSTLAPQYKLRGLTDKWLLRQLAARHLPKEVAHRPKSMFRSKLSPVFLSNARPAWVDQLLSEESLKKAGYFDPAAIARERQRLITQPGITPRYYLFDAMLTCVISTQLWHHLFFGGGLCDLPVWQPVESKEVVF